MVVSWINLSSIVRMIVIILIVMIVLLCCILGFVLWQYNRLWDSISILAKEIRERDKV